MKKKNIIIILSIIISIALALTLMRIFYYSDFSIEDYDHQVKWCSEYEMGYTHRIENKLDALNAIDEVFSLSTDDTYYIHTVSYDKQND